MVILLSNYKNYFFEDLLGSLNDICRWCFDIGNSGQINVSISVGSERPRSSNACQDGRFVKTALTCGMTSREEFYVKRVNTFI